VSVNQKNISFSIIIPVYNRPDEIDELLESLTRQSFKGFEVIIVEDGSNITCKKVVNKYEKQLQIRYIFQENKGPGIARNTGMLQAQSQYFVILDSDVILPDNYLSIVNNQLQKKFVDAYGGPDAAMDNFTPIQKAINYAMTSFLTTGGIRGKSEKAGKFYPRSFNMGISKEVFQKTGGFSEMRYGEDIDLSIRIMKNGFKTALIQQAFVYHKRRNTLKSFYHQVKHSGEARIILHHKHRGSLKPVHFFPALFTIGLVLSVLLSFLRIYWLFYIYLLYFLLLIIDAFKQYKSVKLALYSAIASVVMLTGYGWGFIQTFVRRQDENKK